MIKKLKLIPVGIICLLVMCVLGISLNAQSLEKVELEKKLQQITVKKATLENLTKKSPELKDQYADKKIEIESQESKIRQEIMKLDRQAEQLTINPLTNESVQELDEINSEREQLVEKFNKKIAEKAQLDYQQLYQKAQNLNKEYAAKGIPFKTTISSVGGKQYIQLVELPDLNGVVPKKKQ